MAGRSKFMNFVWYFLGAYQGNAFGYLIVFRLFKADENITWLRLLVELSFALLGVYMAHKANTTLKKRFLILGAVVAIVLTIWLR
ncbi:hypothetical protein GF312_10205 [Candidatus Poribacteria bacterium]|nr:hypothetical protein [Candidatus Poribacteria bacterium]